MKNTRIFCGLFMITILTIACTPASLPSDNSNPDTPLYYGTGGEHSVRPDNEKDG